MKEFDRFFFPRNYSGKVPLFSRKFPEKFRRKFPEISELTTLSVTLAVDEKTLPMATITGRTDRQTDRQTECDAICGPLLGRRAALSAYNNTGISLLSDSVTLRCRTAETEISQREITPLTLLMVTDINILSYMSFVLGLFR